MRAIVKFTSIFLLIFSFLGASALLRVFIRDHFRLQKKRTEIQSRFCKWGLKILQVSVRAVSFNKPSLEARLMVGNHMSYLDILILSSLYPSSYVTSQEIREMPFLGMLCEWAGCLFVERRSRENLSREVSEIKDALLQGLTVTVFPEATSTNGEEILRFRTPLYQAAMDSGVKVQPFCLNYLQINGARFSKGNRDYVCWYGDMEFVPHLWALCRLDSVDVSVQFLDILNPSGFTDHKGLALQSQMMVTEKFQPAV